MASGIWQIPKIPELRNRLLIMVALLGVYRFGVFIPNPGTNRGALKSFFGGDSGTLFDLYNMFSGGALEQFSIFTLGIMPYISASIIIQLLTVVVPALERLQKEGEAGRQKITQYTRYGTIGISVIQGFAIAYGLENMSAPGDSGAVVLTPGWHFRLMTVLTLTTGTAFIMWLGERITEWGIGNGISLIIMAGIIVRFPDALFTTFGQLRTEERNFLQLLVLGVFAIGVIVFIVICERGQRRIPVQYAKRVVGRKVYGGQNTHLPLKINMAGVIPPIFASSIIMFPATVASFWRGNPFLDAVQALFMPGTTMYLTTYAAMTIFFCYFYTSVTFNPADVAENMQKHGGYIPGIRPGKHTAEFIDRCLTRLTLSGSLYIALVCVIPDILISQARVTFYFGGTGLLIVVGVALDLVAQIESHLLTRHYDGLMGDQGKRIQSSYGKRGAKPL
ncbi:MAG TPA: preprotein translocase subunit SecY [Deltaproteobacteria bacterium]|nr:preprotein translocase subunit SecY [Deltaproteobacteria bacterium]HCP47693.1 preprotein translocase subunit SecY [Deltaproteobacteria bacterium]